MSRGFVKEDDQEEAPMIPPRAALPEGETNYVTPKGLEELHEERDDLKKEISELTEINEQERRRALTLLNGKLNLLLSRINTAHVLEPEEQNHEEIRFGAHVTYTIASSKDPVKIQIVGVDEADVKKGKIAFTAPIAHALSGKKEGEKAVLDLGKEKRELQVTRVRYE